MGAVFPKSPSKPRTEASKLSVVRGMIALLLDGTFSGGDRITEAEAVERFGVSRTPVREALLELQGLGLIELRRNCGAVFSSFGPAELKETYAVRTLLEVEATRLAAGRIDPDLLQSLRGAFLQIQETGGIDEDWRIDREFHSAIADSSGNRRLAAEIDRYGDLVQLMREIVGAQALSIHSTTAEDHLAIADALLTGNAERAAQAMQRHLSQASNSAASAVERLRR